MAAVVYTIFPGAAALANFSCLHRMFRPRVILVLQVINCVTYREGAWKRCEMLSSEAMSIGRG